MQLRMLFLAFALACSLGSPASAVQPDEILEDPKLETRAREISTHLRCLVCQNQTIDDSDAPLARDLRVLVRERLVAGDSNAEVIDFVVDRYGEFVLLRPRLVWHNALLWGAPLVLLMVGCLVVFLAMRRRGEHRPTELSAEEREALDRVMSREH